jgi:hypothetical protein
LFQFHAQPLTIYSAITQVSGVSGVTMLGVTAAN